MEKSKSKCSTSSRDRLSELPDSLIFEIFWRLPMRELVQTSLLSQRWKNLWLSAPHLNFEDCKKEFDPDRVRKFTNRTLIVRSAGAKIERFKMDFGPRINKLMYDDIHSWLSYANNHEVRELYVDLKYDTLIKKGNPTKGTKEATKGTKEYWVPQFLYSCSSLKKLCLKGCNLPIPTNDVSWKELDYLSIDGYVLNRDLISRVLRGSPKLKTLILKFMENRQDLCVESSSLKDLRVYKYLVFRHDDPSMNTELRISAPNLEALEMGDVPYSKFSMNVSALSRATLVFDGVFDEADKSYFSHHFFSRNDFVGEILNQTLPAVQQEVVLSDWCIKVLAATKKRCTYYTSFPNVKSLTMRHGFNDYVQFVRLLEIFPRLKKLVLQDNERYYNQNDESLNSEAESYPKFEANNSKPFLVKLRAVDITWSQAQGDNIFPFIALLLKYASKLENMVFRVKEVEPPSPLSNSLLVASQQLLRMPKSSPNCTIITRPYVESND